MLTSYGGDFTADWGYIRFRKPEYSQKDLFDWAGRIKAHDWQAVYAFFKHEEKGRGPEFAKRFISFFRDEPSRL